ncbi:MAG TPA: TlpA disulfide reductase family protein [Bacteroidia bacterium]|nr:TlpA disulfide reductase family protein [Bacteroidia bacterium]
MVVPRKYAIVFLLVIAGGVAFFMYNKYRVAPNLDVEHLTLKNPDGSIVNSNDFRGKTLFVNYWATWCGECLREMPSIESAYRQSDPNDVIFLMITDDPPEKINAFLAKHNYPMKFVYVEERLQELGINTIPTTYIFDDEGYELFNHVGGLDWSDPGLVGLLKK